MNESPGGSADGDGLLDMKQFNSMADALGDSFSTILQEFFESCEDFSQRLERASLAGELEKLREVCHEIKGAAGLIGLGGIATAAATWEAKTIAGERIAEAELTGRFERLVAETRSHAASLGWPLTPKK